MKDKKRIGVVTVNLMVGLFAVAVALWIFYCQRYFVLNYHEQVQLFRLDNFYFLSYMSRPGGLVEYTGSFLTQFYCYPAVGSMIIAGISALVVLLFYHICKPTGTIGWLPFLLFIPAVLMFMSFVNIHFNISYAVGVVVALIGCRIYMAFRLPARSFAGLILLTAVYFTAAGNAFLWLVLIVIFEFFERKYKFKYLYLLLLLIWSVLLPWLSRQFIYTVSLADAYFSLTFLKMLFPTWKHQALWLSFPTLYLGWHFIAPLTNRWRFAPWKLLLPNGLLVATYLFFGAQNVYDRNAEILYRMDNEVQQNHWETTLSLSKTYPGRNRLVCYYTNIALARSGQLPYRMFHFKQVGAAGLFFDNEMTYFSMSEVYYQLGMIQEAEHGAFEALLFSPKEPRTRTLRRLVYTHIARRDSINAVKYLNYFKQSPTYRGWAQQQHTNLAYTMADPLFQIPGTPAPCRHADFFIDYALPDQTLQILLNTNPQHRMAFEYLMAYYLLQKDIEKVKWCIDTYYQHFDYPTMPTHYEEALLVYQSLTKSDEGFAKQYPVSNPTRERFKLYNQTFNNAKNNKHLLEQLEKQFGNTYWYYLHFNKPVSLQKNEEKNRY